MFMKIRWLNKMSMVKKEDGVLLSQEQRIEIEKQLQKAIMAIWQHTTVIFQSQSSPNYKVMHEKLRTVNRRLQKVMGENTFESLNKGVCYFKKFLQKDRSAPK